MRPRLSRRSFALTVAAASLSRAGTALAQLDASTPVATPAATWPREVDGTLGTVTISEKPSRVLALSDWYETDYLLAQGLTPIAYGLTSRQEVGFYPWLVEYGIEEIPSYTVGADGPDLEAIIGMGPDLIVADPYIAEQVVDQLNAIAPTVGLPTPYTGSTDWREGQRLCGIATGMEAEAEAAIQETDGAYAAGQELLQPYKDRTVSVAYTTAYNGGSLFFAPDDSQEAQIIRELGLNFKGYTDNSPQSMESVNTLAEADIVLTYDSADNRSIFEGSPLVQALPVAQNGQLVVVPEDVWPAIFSPATLSVRWLIPKLVDLIVLGAKGEGKKLGSS